MSTSRMSAELADLLEIFCLEELTPPQAARLEAIMRTDSAHREHAVRFMLMHAMAERWESQSPVFQLAQQPSRDGLREALEAFSSAEPDAQLNRSPRLTGLRHPLATAVLICITTCAVLMIFALWLERHHWWLPPAVESLPPVAHVQKLENVVWSSGTKPCSQNEALAAGSLLAIEAGVVELRLAQGTTLTLDGPAEWIINDRNSATLQAGKLRARVPVEAIGFILDTPTARIVDLGTEFEAHVSKHGQAEIQVIHGVVEARPRGDDDAGSQGVRISAGNSVRIAWGKIGPVTPTTVAGSSVPPGEPSEPPPAELIALYRFDGNLFDSSGNGRTAKRGPTTRFAAGKEGKAASFSGRVQDVIELPIDARPAAMPDVTFGAWVRTHQLVRAVVMSADDNCYGRQVCLDERQGLVHGNEFRMAMLAGKATGVASAKNLPVHPKHWIFVAVTYERDKQEATLYAAYPGARQLTKVFFSNVQIDGGHSTMLIGTNPDFSEHTWVGEIDNAFVFRGALNQQQLEAIRVGGADAIMRYAKTP